MKWRVICSVLVMGLFVTFGAHSLRADSDDDWLLVLEPYLMIPKASIDSTVNGQTAGVTLSQQDIIDHFFLWRGRERRALEGEVWSYERLHLPALGGRR